MLRCLLVVLLPLSTFCNAAPDTPSSDAKVSIVDHGDWVTLDNGIAAVDVQKSTGNLTKLLYQGESMLASPAYLNLHVGDDDTDFKDHAATYKRIAEGSFQVVEDPSSNDGEAAAVRIVQPASESSPFGLELNYVLRRGVSGLYAYLAISHEAGQPGGEITQIRWLLRLKDEIFDFIAIDDQRRYEMPPSGTPVRPLGPKESLLVTSGPYKGRILDKYHHFVDAGEHFVHGWLGRERKVGCWMVSASTEDVNGGPTKQHNTAHFERILMKIFSCTHYGSAPVSVGKEAWRKVYGPCLLYFNSGASPEALWQDAKAKAEKERASWPYGWVKDSGYAGREQRGVVKGQLQFADPRDPAKSLAGAWVGLAAPGKDWQQQSNDYQFWTRTDADGRFELPAVRAGSYTLYAFSSGVMDELRRDGIVVTAGQTADLGGIEWRPLHFGKVLWQIGTPDRTAKEFRHGDDYRHWGLGEKYPQEFPQDVTFEIGKSQERTDWNYAQVAVRDGKKWRGTVWRVLFDLDAKPAGADALLRIGIAAATNAELVVAMNGTTIGRLTTGKDSAMIRASIHGQYAELNLKFKASLLKKGRNVLTLEQLNGRSLQTNIMYDCLRLEVAEPAK
jgi:rhamnogalacturonan endolyase